MEYLRKLNTARLDAATERHHEWLLTRKTGATTCQIKVIKTPPGSGSVEGEHTHTHDQLYFILSGTMGFEIDGTEYLAEPNTFVVIPMGTRHRNFNRGTVPVVHFGIDVPLADGPGGDERYEAAALAGGRASA